MPEPSDRAGVRAVAREIFSQALEATTIRQAFREHVSCDRGILRIRDDLYDLHAQSRVVVISLGKAAHSMLRAFEEQAGEQFEGIVASSVPPEFQLRGFRYFHGGHPLPNAESVNAARAMLNSVRKLTESSLVIFLISGGGSATVEKPIDDVISLPDLIESYRILVNCGASIAEINAIRKHLSAIKGGRLAQAAYPAQQVSVLVSDVPDHTPDALSSGPTMPDSTTVADCYRILNGTDASQSPTKHQASGGNRNLAERFPPSVRELFERHELDETPKSDDPAFIRARWWTVLSNAALLESAKTVAERLGWTVHIDNSCDDWDYKRAADYLLERLRGLRQRREHICLLSGGEVTVEVENGGVGGRNQQFVLYCAEKLKGDICVLSAGSDGIDGNSRAAGSVADSTTLERAHARGLDAGAHLSRFDAYSLFEALGDAIVTGPTGTNLRDLRILLAS